MKSSDNEWLSLFAAKTVLKRTRPILDEADGVRKGRDPACIHDMRVATRRLSTALRLFEDCFPPKQARAWDRRLRRLRRALGRARDLDVQIAFVKEFLRESRAFLGGAAEAGFRPGIRRLLQRLRQRRKQCQKRVAKAVNRFERREVLADMKGVAKEVRAAARRSPMPHAAGVRRHAKDAILARLGELRALEP
ncbi:MAG: CHAD domain-containing protein, partial [Planctomycetes bacterium]|nr:CHAD domain-containing protein [Planctomycetota bacterium]